MVNPLNNSVLLPPPFLVGLIRRRAMMSSIKKDIGAIRLVVKNGNRPNIWGNRDLSYIQRMVVDGQDVTPVANYEFADSEYHEVLLYLWDNTTLPNNAFNIGNFTRKIIDIPSTYVNFGGESIRGIGGDQLSDLIIRSKVMPSFGLYNQYGHTVGTLYVPSSLIEAYTELNLNFGRGIYAIEESEYK